MLLVHPATRCPEWMAFTLFTYACCVTNEGNAVSQPNSSLSLSFHNGRVSSLGRLATLLDDPSARAMVLAAHFCHEIRQFQKTGLNLTDDQCFTKALQLRDELDKRCVAHQKGVNSQVDFLDEAVISCNAAMKRFTSCIDVCGQSYIKIKLKSGSDDLSSAVVAMTEVLTPPTTFLERCLVTCQLCTETPNELRESDLGSKFKDMLAIMPQYVKVSSVDHVLMKDISPEKAAACDSFIQQVEAKLSEHVNTLQGTFQMLERLENKYKSLSEGW